MADNNIYGVWLNGLINNTTLWNRYKSTYKGCHFRPKWSGYEITADVFSNSYILNQFNYAIAEGLPISFEMFVASTDGTATATYVFSPPYSTPKLTTDRGIYPYFFDTQFKARFNNLYAALNTFINSLPVGTQALLKSWESDEGSTGDTGNIKGNIIGVTINGIAQSPPFTSYLISDSDWNDYKVNDVWPDWYDDIQANIPFVKPMINPGNDGQNFPLITTDLSGAWNKAGNPTHNYNLPGEYYYWQRLISVFSSEKDDNRARGELEETPTLSWFTAAKKSSLSSVLWSCLHHGVDVVSIALNYMNDMIGTDTTFITKVNKYFGTRNVSETNVGFCKFRKVINITDTDLYSVADFGVLVSAGDLSEYTAAYNAITANSSLNTYQKQMAYASLLVSGKSGSTYVNPARLSALQAAFPTAAFRTLSTAQEQDSRNMDYGVYMIPDNYCKYVTQYDPEGTSKGYWRLFDTTDYYGRFLRGFDTANGKNTIYLSTELCGDNNYQVTILVTYLNSGTNQWSLQYHNGDTQVSAGTITNTSTNTYLTHTFTIADFQGGGQLLHSTDFILNNENATDTKFDAVEVIRVAQNSGAQRPTANAGADIFVTLPETTAELDGSASTAGTGTITVILWEQTSGDAVTIVNPASLITDITGLTAGTREFQLTITNSDALSSSDKVSVFTAASAPPTANAGASQLLEHGTTQTTLFGSGTGNGLTYMWTLVVGANITIINPTSAITAITGLADGEYILQLTVTDNEDRTATDGVVISVEPESFRKKKKELPDDFNYRIINNSDSYNRIIFFVVAENNRGLSAEELVIKSNEISATVNNKNQFYLLETLTGSVAGFFILKITGNNHFAAVTEFETRTAFKSDVTNIQKGINFFINSNEWNCDSL